MTDSHPMPPATLTPQEARQRLAQVEQLMVAYRSAIDEVETKLRVLQREFTHANSYNPIENVSTRLKSMDSLLHKARRRGCTKIDDVRTHITDVAGVRSLFDEAENRIGAIDIAVNTTGMVLRKPISDISEDEYDAMFDINSKAAFFFIQEAGKRLNDGGKIISLGTSLLAAFTDGYSTYAGGKSPVEHFTRAAAKEYGARGISVNSIAPGPMDTPFFYGQETPERVEFHKSQAMKNQLTQIEDIAPIVRFLADEGWWITGQTIFANGGYTTR